jgi:hypothetical protein
MPRRTARANAHKSAVCSSAPWQQHAADDPADGPEMKYACSRSPNLSGIMFIIRMV